MPYRHDGVVPYHPWTGILHNLFYLLAHIDFIAMDGAVAAGGLFVFERALKEAFFCISNQFNTRMTKLITNTVMGPTIEFDHCIHGFIFIFKTRHI